HGRTASGLALAVLGAAVVIRGAGDVMRQHGSWLSWFSPIAWVQQTRPFHDARWWPLLLGVVFSAAAVVLALLLQGRRDHGAGFLRPRSAAAAAPSWLRSPLTLSLRLECNSM